MGRQEETSSREEQATKDTLELREVLAILDQKVILEVQDLMDCQVSKVPKEPLELLAVQDFRYSKKSVIVIFVVVTSEISGV